METENCQNDGRLSIAISDLSRMLGNFIDMSRKRSFFPVLDLCVIFKVISYDDFSYFGTLAQAGLNNANTAARYLKQTPLNNLKWRVSYVGSD